MGRHLPTPHLPALAAIVFAVLALELPSAAESQGDDKAYCAQLSSLYRRYVKNSPGRRFDLEATMALEDCQKGKTDSAIEVLERKLRESGFSLPKEFKP